MIKKTILYFSPIILLIVIWLSISIGTLNISLYTIIEAFVNYNPEDYSHIVIINMRIPRTIIGLIVGVSLSISGVAIQGVTRNPLSDPSILGVNAGAAFGIVLALTFLNITSPAIYIWFSLIGAFLSLFLVLIISGLGGGNNLSPGKLVLSGVVVSSLLNAWISGVLILNQEALDQLRFWLIGSISGRDIENVKLVAPFIIIGLVGIIVLSPHLNILTMGGDKAKSLGMNVKLYRLLLMIFVVLLSSAAVTIAGPIGFIGLAVPHTVRTLVGNDYKKIILFSFLWGPIFLLSSDIIGRVIVMPSEIQTGIITAFIGAPFLIFVARKKNLRFS